MKLSESTRRKMGESRTGQKNHKWKGDCVGYAALHEWVRRHFGKAKICENCGTLNSKKYEWANLGTYNRQRKNWKQLCVKCHHAMDNTARKGWATKKLKFSLCA